MNLDDCELIFDKALGSKNESEFCHAITPLFTQYQILSLAYGRGSMYWRARIIQENPYTNICELKYPPEQYAKRGRLNDEGASCFYISARKETALAEVNAKEGQMIQLAAFRIMNDRPIKLIAIGEYANVIKSGYMHFSGKDPDSTLTRFFNSMPREEALRKLYIDSFFASVLNDVNAASNDYKFSRALAKTVYSKNTAGGIIFPSVKDRGGFNIGIKAKESDRSFHNMCCMVVKVKKPRRFGVIDYDVIQSASHLSDNGDFVWGTSEDPNWVGIYNMTKEEYEVAARNPKDRNALLNILNIKK